MVIEHWSITASLENGLLNTEQPSEGNHVLEV